ncbi:hypothetical protein CNMCM7927_009352 [Aspergillus lentulus]|nr:hypothetical protein CNMCM7927_009352 [Aspergillus lentulus]
MEILDNISKLQNEVQNKDDELTRTREEMLERVTKKQTAIDEMFEANEKEKAKQKEIMMRIDSLEKTIITRDKEFAEQKSLTDNLTVQIEKLRSDYAKKTSDLTEARKDIDSLRQNVRDRGTIIEKMKSAGSELKRVLSTAKEKVKELEDEKAALQKSHKAKELRLNRLEGFAAALHNEEEDKMMDNFVNLWEYATTEIYAQIKEDLPKETLGNRLRWDVFWRQSNLAVQHRVPLPLSNSTAAKQMRLAVILAILAREIDKYIFQPTYAIAEDTQIREALTTLAASDSEKESFCRSILLSIDPETQSKALHSRMQIVIRNVSSYLYELLSESHFSNFRQSLEKVVQKAAEVWQPIQRSKRRYEPDFEPLKWEDDEWSPLMFPDTDPVVNQISQKDLGESLLTVFPRITAVEDGNRFPLTYVVQLRRSQAPCVKAEQEMAQISSPPAIGRMASNRPRRRSNASSNTTNMNGMKPDK